MMNHHQLIEPALHKSAFHVEDKKIRIINLFSDDKLAFF